MFPKVKTQLMEQFQRNIPELDEEQEKHFSTLGNITELFVSQCFKNLNNNDYTFSKLDYSNSADILDSMLPTEPAIKLASSLNKLYGAFDSILNPQDLMKKVVLNMFTQIETRGS